MALEGFFNFFLCHLQFVNLLLELLLPGPSFSLSCLGPLSETSNQKSVTENIPWFICTCHFWLVCVFNFMYWWYGVNLNLLKLFAGPIEFLQLLLIRLAHLSELLSMLLGSLQLFL